jgi:hypothetical protein
MGMIIEIAAFRWQNRPLALVVYAFIAIKYIAISSHPRLIGSVMRLIPFVLKMEPLSSGTAHAAPYGEPPVSPP